MAMILVVVVEGRVRLALIFGVVVRDINALAGDVADVVDVAKLAGFGIDENIAHENFLAVRHDKRALFGLAEEGVDERRDFAIIAHVHKNIRLEPRGSLEVIIQNDF